MAKRLMGLFLGVGLAVVTARAQTPPPLFDGGRWSLPPLRSAWQARRCWCPDDYDAKCPPRIVPMPRGCGDDYDAKCLPPVPANPRGREDDYCPKTCPLRLGRLCEAWYRCPLPPGCRGSR
ncbi:MAG: hypothetical protein NZ700_14250 [Gemmataceae bacterium]|nr:hypothetical protein [Gemmataceae bacterium]MDW8264586.1 hypothetical protein [Gemmataceae bacterium]